MTLPIDQLEGRVAALFSDLDGTLTSHGRLETATLTALEAVAASIPAIVVTGRSAGWGQAIMSLLPVTAVVAENGGLLFHRDGDQVRKQYQVDPIELPSWRKRMSDAVDEVAELVPGARLSSDSCYREVDLAIDWNEEASLSRDDADQVVEHLRSRGFAAVASSVHVNFNPPLFDKLSACRRVVAEILGGDPDDLESYLYIGDALNDQPMFAGFPRSVGVANVRDFWDQLEHRPANVADAREGAGFRELVERVLLLNRRAAGSG